MADSFIVDLTSLTSEGEGVGLCCGRKIFVPGGFPGDQIEVVINDRFKNYFRGCIRKIVNPSPWRCVPKCPSSVVCGGCSLMGLSYDRQLMLKRERVFFAFNKFANVKLDLSPCNPSPLEIGYRNKVDFTIDIVTGRMGFYEQGTKRLVDIPNCFLQDENLNAIWNWIRLKVTLLPVCYRIIIKKSLFSEKVLICFATQFSERTRFNEFTQLLIKENPIISGVVLNFRNTKDNGFFSDHSEIIWGEEYLLEKLLDGLFKIGVSNFFQINLLQAENLFRFVINAVDTDDVLDGFCGVGTLSILLRNKCSRILGVEFSQSSVDSARENAILNKADHCFFICGRLEKIFFKLPLFQTVILNPPRSGINSRLIHELIKKKPSKIIIISCHPETLARDVGLLQKEYLIRNVSLFDLFPQTMHVESVVELTAK